MIIAHDIRQLGIGGAEKTMLIFLRHLAALGHELHAFYPRGADDTRAGQIAEVAELQAYEGYDDLARRLRWLRPHILHRHRSGYADPLDAMELDARTRVVETNIYGDHGSRADLRLFVSATVAREQDWRVPKEASQEGCDAPKEASQEGCDAPKEGSQEGCDAPKEGSDDDDGQVDVLYNPCEPPVASALVPRAYRRFAGLSPEDARRVVVFGRVGRPDAHIYDPIALETYARIETPLTRFLALAPPPNMIDHARWLGLRTFMALEPVLDEAGLSRFYSLIDVLAHARRDGETCGMNIQEAMYHGLPVITHISDNHNAQPEILGEGYPWIAPRGDLEAYTAFMTEALQSEARRRELGARNEARARAEFDARVIVGKLIGHYERLCAEAVIER